MNQILYVPKRKSYFLFFKIELIFSILFLLGSVLFISFSLTKHDDASSNKVLDSYRILELYSATNVSLENFKEPPLSPFILGTISIERLRYILPYYF